MTDVRQAELSMRGYGAAPLALPVKSPAWLALRAPKRSRREGTRQIVSSAPDAAVVDAPLRYRVGDLVVDVGRARVTRDKQEIPLPKLSFDLLVALLRAAPNVVSLEA